MSQLSGDFCVLGVGFTPRVKGVINRVGTGSPGHRVIIVTRYETRIFSNFSIFQLCHWAAKLANTIPVITHWLLLSCVDFNKHFMWTVVCILYSGIYKSVMAQCRSCIGSWVAFWLVTDIRIALKSTFGVHYSTGSAGQLGTVRYTRV